MLGTLDAIEYNVLARNFQSDIQPDTFVFHFPHQLPDSRAVRKNHPRFPNVNKRFCCEDNHDHKSFLDGKCTSRISKRPGVASVANSLWDVDVDTIRHLAS